MSNFVRVFRALWDMFQLKRLKAQTCASDEKTWGLQWVEIHFLSLCEIHCILAIFKLLAPIYNNIPSYYSVRKHCSNLVYWYIFYFFKLFRTNSCGSSLIRLRSMARKFFTPSSVNNFSHLVTAVDETHERRYDSSSKVHETPKRKGISYMRQTSYQNDEVYCILITGLAWSSGRG